MFRLRLSLILILFCLSGCGAQGVRDDAAGDSAASAYTRLGMQYLQARDVQGAKSAFQKSLSLNAKNAEAYNGLALAFQLEGEAVLAEDYFRKAVAVEPQSAMIHNNLGAFLFAAGRYAEACNELARATEDPFYNRRAQAFENLGRCYNHLKRSEAAAHAFERALQISPGRVISMVELADLKLADGRADIAAAYFERFSDLVERRRAEHFPKSLWVGIRIARAQGDASLAAIYALLLKNQFPSSAEYRLYEESAQ